MHIEVAVIFMLCALEIAVTGKLVCGYAEKQVFQVTVTIGF